jgi:hypothetical protein
MDIINYREWTKSRMNLNTNETVSVKKETIILGITAKKTCPDMDIQYTYSE